MTNYPTTDPAEIAKLPPAHYLCVDGTTATRRYGKTLLRPWSVEGRELFLTDAELADLRGGIAARLVPEGTVPDVAVRELGTIARELGDTKAQRDEAIEVLRILWRWVCYDADDHTAQGIPFRNRVLRLLEDQEKNDD